MTGEGARDRAEIEAEMRALERRLEELRAELDQSAAAPAVSDEGERGPLRVLCADDDADVRALIKALVDSADDLELVGTGTNTEEAIALGRETKPDVAVLDLSMPGGGGIVAALAIVRDSPATKVVAFTSLDTMEAQLEVMRAGAVSFLVKGAAPDEILRTIRESVRW